MAGMVKTGVNMAGGIILPLQEFARTGGQPIGVLGCPVAGHAPCPVEPPHCSATMAGCSSFARIDGAGICRAGDSASCGHPADGQSWARVNG